MTCADHDLLMRCLAARDVGVLSWSHLLALAWTLPLIAGSCWLGRRWRGEARERRLARTWGVFVVFVNVCSLAFWLAPRNFDIEKSLPLQLCDLALIASACVFLAKWRLARTLVYFWGIGLSTQAFVTPTVRVGPDDVHYWLFWVTHLCIVGSAAYDLIVRRYRPHLRDLLLAIGVSLLYVAIVFELNHLIGPGANYGYVGRSSPLNPTIIDKLGPWPGRVLLIVLIGVSVQVALWAVWRLPGLRDADHRMAV